MTPTVEVVGRAPRALEHIPGTAQLVRKEDLRQLAPQSGADVLRTVPGLNVIGEDPMGLRLNLGIRGLDPNRSRKVLILEDGMPVSLNPYGAPEMYYTPPIERMERIEVVKGSGQVLWGPQTIGGLVNFITRDPPPRFGAEADIRYGSFNYLLARAGVGATHGPVGWRLDLIHRRFDGPRALNLALTDLGGKLRLRLTSSSTLILKLALYDEGSAATYLGLTTPQYQTDPTLNLATHDRFEIRRYALGLTHQHLFGPRLLLQTSAYAYQTERAWRRQIFDRADRGLAYERICDATGRCGPPGDAGILPDDTGGSIFFRPEAAIRDRIYGVAGVEPRLTWSWSAPRVLSGELTALWRFHYERARDQVRVTSFPTARAGDIHDDEVRDGYAVAAAVQHRFILWDRLFITPGLRLETFWSSRTVLRVAESVPGRGLVGRDVEQGGSAFSWALIPGLGISARVLEPLTLFGGVHRGYAPPRSRDAVSPTGQNLQLDPELSWNFELGARLQLARWLNGEAAGFLLEFENQIIPPSEAGGAVSGGMFNTGHSRHAGLELSGTFDLAGALGARSFALPLNANYTYLPLAIAVGGPFDGVRLPYAPEHLLYAQVRFAHAVGISAQVGLTYVSAQFADKGATPTPSADGLVGELPGYLLLDARIGYTLARLGLTAYLAGKNLTNQVYIASRAPAGIQPAGFLQLFGGLEWQLPSR
ncbi:MAG: TonB-dependent receptor [Myxococcales bacterium]|nr:TonB-dependent receptor [Myxococcota bacterium]MDW8282676.1 TonB-dependent receptor [Myxococcales bacterium]